MIRRDFPILNSKVRVPPLPELFLPRPRIEDRITFRLDSTDAGTIMAPFRKFIYLSAPPGYGKTICLARMAVSCGCNHGWLTFDALDNNLRRAAVYLDEAITRGGVPAEPEHLEAERPAGDPADRDGGLILSVLHRIERYENPFLLVLDDLHEITNPVILNTLRDFLEYLPGNCRLALATREDLAMPLHTHRQADRLIEMRADTLRATEDELYQYLRMADTDPGETGRKSLWKKTAGWWSCIKLFSISWKQLSAEQRPGFLERFRGTDRFIAEFLLESLYSVLPAEVSRFASRVSIPEFFNEGLALILSRPEGLEYRSCLDTLDRMNLLIYRESERLARYRFHPLLREYLRHRLPPETRAGVHAATAAWFQDAGLLERAERHREHARRLGATGRTVQPEDQESYHPGRTSRKNTIPDEFSRREIDLLSALALGLSNDEIGARLFISTGTVKWHLNNIYGKMGVHNRTEAVHVARSLDLI